MIDHEGHDITLTDSLWVNIVEIPGNNLPPEGSKVTLQPEFSWNPAANASWYKVRLYHGRDSSLFWSPGLKETTYTLPSAQRLDPDRIYQYRIYAYHEDPNAGDIDNYSTTMDQLGMMPYFWTEDFVDSDGDGVADTEDAFPTDPSASEDSDGDGYPDGWNAGYSQSDSTSNPKLSLDGFPSDQYLHVDLNADGQVGLPEGIHVLRELCFNPSSSRFSLDALIHCLQVLCNYQAKDSTEPIAIPTRSVTVDGLADDWNGLDPLVTSPEGCNYSQCIPGSDVKNLWLARDGETLFFLFETWTPVDTTGEAAYRLWFDNNRNSKLDGDPGVRQVSAAYSEDRRNFNITCKGMGFDYEFIEVDSEAKADDYFVEGRFDVCMLGISERFDLHSGTHSQTSINNYDRFQVVEDMSESSWAIH